MWIKAPDLLGFIAFHFCSKGYKMRLFFCGRAVESYWEILNQTRRGHGKEQSQRKSDTNLRVKEELLEITEFECDSGDGMHCYWSLAGTPHSALRKRIQIKTEAGNRKNQHSVQSMPFLQKANTTRVDKVNEKDWFFFFPGLGFSTMYEPALLADFIDFFQNLYVKTF